MSLAGKTSSEVDIDREGEKEPEAEGGEGTQAIDIPNRQEDNGDGGSDGDSDGDGDSDDAASVVSATTASSLMYAMAQKYLHEHRVDSFIEIFGTSPCKLASQKALRLLVLNHKNITGAGRELLRFASYSKNVSQLDLAYNELRRWSEIANILSALPQLLVLNLSHNPIEKHIALKYGPRALPIMSQLHTLILNGVRLPPSTIRSFTATMPALEELHMSDTAFDDGEWDRDGAGEQEAVCSTVTVLHLNACKISDWARVLRLLRLFPQILHLYLAENPIAAVATSTTPPNSTSAASNIRSLILSRSLIARWEDVEALAASMPRLENFRLRKVPLLEGLSEEERFHLVLPRIPSLKTFNGSPISARQREESERFFNLYYAAH